MSRWMVQRAVGNKDRRQTREGDKEAIRARIGLFRSRHGQISQCFDTATRGLQRLKANSGARVGLQPGAEGDAIGRSRAGGLLEHPLRCAGLSKFLSQALGRVIHGTRLGGPGGPLAAIPTTQAAPIRA